MKVQCCVCGKIREGERWRFALYSELTSSPVSSGYCPACAEKAMLAMRQERMDEVAESTVTMP